ncbi:hypothetical protein [Pseudomonas kuykendallii]|uniref:XRE family transcriptional regulator n=1 Tax=Pseudomonas kuykendallii TaxID=1007099 RepID=A0A2W5FAS7_9PSED|nr:hypothetical protein [Pseudomonas kuykendallii]PZP26699.1 MAG: XRE family transcriptional regulator [Pseudomonas kuykendallii]
MANIHTLIDTPLEALGARLREERMRLGFEVADFALLMGEEEAAVVLMEMGLRPITTSYLELLECRTEVSISYVLTGRRQ